MDCYKLMTNKEEEEEEEERHIVPSDMLSNLPAKSEVILEVFSRLSPKNIFQFKCVSKTISELTQQGDFITKHSHASPSLTGFLYQRPSCPDDFVTAMDYDEISFVPLESDLDCLPDPSFEFLKQSGKDDVVRLIDSCNGFLLCSNTNWNDYVTTCFVCNPLTREKVVLPHPRRRSNRVYYALLADLTSSGCLQYKVLCLFNPKGKFQQGTELLVFSSETGEWEEREYRLPVLHHETMMGSKVFFNGSLFWDCFDGHILLFQLNSKKSQRCYELIEAPRAPLGRCLLKFKDKLICFCHGLIDEFPAWSLYMNEKKELKWKLEECEDFGTLSEGVSGMLLENRVRRSKVTPIFRFKIIAHEPESDMLFFFMEDSIFSYKIKERKLLMVRSGCYRKPSWTWRFHTKSFVVPYRHSLAAIQNGKRAEEEKGRELTEEEEEEEKGKKQNSCDSVVIHDDYVELENMYERCANNVRPQRSRRRRRTTLCSQDP